MTRPLGRLAVAVAAWTALSCASGGIRLPDGPGVPLPDFATFHRDATAACAGIHSLSLAMSLSGRSAGRRLRGTVHAGLASPGAVRLEALAPFGGPVFVFAAQSGDSTLVLTREDRVLTGAEPAAVIEAITGIRLSPDDLLAILSGCVTIGGRPTAGHAYGDSWRSLDLDDGAMLYFRRQGEGWALVVGVRDAFRVDYEGGLGSAPRRIRLRARGRATVPTDLTLTVTEAETNPNLGTDVFAVGVPPSAVPMTLEELRRRGPLGERSVAEAPAR